MAGQSREVDQNETANEPRFVVGIDLGTTNSAVCYVDTEHPESGVRTFAIPQLVAPGQVATQDTLPSFLYQPARREFSAGALGLPWTKQEPTFAVGTFAREQGRAVPDRVIESAKSWLCHRGVDREAALLPWHGAEDVEKRSPVAASAAYLGHIREAWDAEYPAAPLDEQDVVVTLPASFDEIARELTIAAARQAGLNRILLIEEPQAAFYAWIERHRDSWADHVTAGQTILICDIGGGTSDFTLLRVRQTIDGEAQFHRIAVGEHLILGGDNLDLALAHHIEGQLSGTEQLSPRQWGVVVRSCRHAKEVLLSPDGPESMAIAVPGSGSKLIGGSRQVTVRRAEVQELILSGFFPDVPLGEPAAENASGFQEFGLPYAADPAVTRHLSEFLSKHERDPLAPDADDVRLRPDLVLLNGGVFSSPLIRDRLLEVIAQWYREDNDAWRPTLLANPRLDLAVAHGAAYYGLVRRGQGVRIAAGLPRTYYVGIGGGDAGGEQAAPQALCVMPAGAEPGHEVAISEHPLALTLAAPVEFPIHYSSTRLTDPAGAMVAVDREQLTSLPPIRTVLKSRRSKDQDTVAVELHARLNEIGTLELWCAEVDGGRSWQLQFDVRAATVTDAEGHTGAGEAAGVLDMATVERSRAIIEETFQKGGAEPSDLMKRLGSEIDLPREEWPPSLLRKMWEALIDTAEGRALSAQHEARWLNLTGFVLRPGYGLALDDWRVAETWKFLRGKLAHPTPHCLAEWWVLWRRIAGGLSRGQQQALATPLLTGLREARKKSSRGSRRGRGGRRGANPHERAESWRMLGALEDLPVRIKTELGDLALSELEQGAGSGLTTALVWTVGRLGTRQPVAGPLNNVVAAKVATSWIDRLLGAGVAETDLSLTLMQLARKTGDRYRDIDEETRKRVVRWMTHRDASPELIMLVAEGGHLAAEQGEAIFGDALPVGLRLLSE